MTGLDQHRVTLCRDTHAPFTHNDLDPLTTATVGPYGKLSTFYRCLNTSVLYAKGSFHRIEDLSHGLKGSTLGQLHIGGRPHNQLTLFLKPNTHPSLGRPDPLTLF
jgi:hypothetical protein